MLKKQPHKHVKFPKIPRGTARRARRESAREVYSGDFKYFHIFWNHGMPGPESQERARKAAVNATIGIEHNKEQQP